MRFSRVYFVILIVLFAFGGPTSARAEEKAEASAVLDVDYAVLESQGVADRTREGALNADLWKNASRSALTELINIMPLESKSPAQQKLIRGFLLTAASAKTIKNDIEIQPGQDLLTLRIEKLLEAGLYKDAFALYTVDKDRVPYHEKLARNGVLTMLWNGEKSLSCLEAKTLEDRFGDINFWQEFLAYCDATLAEETDTEALAVLKNSDRKTLKKAADSKDYQFSYSPKAFGTLDSLEQAILAGDRKIDPRSIKNIDEVPAAHIGALLLLENLPDEKRFRLLSRAVEWGVEPANALDEFYTSLLKPAAGQSEEEQTPFVPSAEWEQIPLALQQATQTHSSEEKWTIIRNALALHKSYGIYAFLPFSDLIEHLSPKDMTLEELTTLIKLMILTNKDIPGEWFDSLKTEKASEIKEASLHAAAFIIRSSHNRTNQNNEEIQEILQKKPSKTAILIAYLLDHFNSQPTKEKKNNTYEKEFFLTFSQDYVMPSVYILDQIEKAHENGAVAETVLLSLVMLHNQDLSGIYPGTLSEVLQGLENVGLTYISQSLAVEAILGSIQ